MVFQEIVACLKLFWEVTLLATKNLHDEKKSNSFNKENKSSESAALLRKISSPLLHDLRCKNKLDRNTMRSSL